MKIQNPEKIIVSGCLAGLPCSHDGRNRLNAKIQALVEEGRAIPVCPEQLGGRPTPREAAEISGGSGEHVLAGNARVLTESGDDVSSDFIAGAHRTLEIAKDQGCRKAILKARSPSCGMSLIYDGNFNGRLKTGNGVTAAILLKDGLEVLTDEENEQLELVSK